MGFPEYEPDFIINHDINHRMGRRGVVETINQVRRQFTAGEFDFSHHAFRRAVERNVSEQEIREAGAAAIIVEEYPADKYEPSSLILGFTSLGRPLQIQISLAGSSKLRIVTLYEPSEDVWEGYARRR